MLPMPAITCWSSSSGLSRVRRPASSARSVDRRRGRRRAGRRPRRASSGSSTSTWSGSNTTTSPNVRGSTNHSSSAGSPDSASTTWVCGGRGDPAGASSSWPVIRRWTISVSPVSSGSSRYLPRRSAASTVAPVSPSMTCWADVRRTVRSRPTSTRSIVPPDDPRRRGRAGRSRPRAAQAPARGESASSRAHGRRGRGLLGRLLRAAGALAEHRAVDDHRGEEPLGVVGPLGPRDVLRRRPAARRRPAPAAATCGRGGRGGRRSRRGAGRSAARSTS